MNSSLADRPTAPVSEPAVDDAPPVNVARLGMTLLLTAELMLFSGLIAAYLVLRDANALVFAGFGNDIINRLIATLIVTTMLFVCALLTIASRAVPARRATAELTIALLAGATVLTLTTVGWHRLSNRATIIAVDPTSRVQYVYDGAWLSRDARSAQIQGLRAPADTFDPLDPHAIGSGNFPQRSETTTVDSGRFDVALADATVVTYGPWKNVYFSCFYLLTGTLALHVLAATLLAGVALTHAIRSTLTAHRLGNVSLYWQFVTLASGVVFLLLGWN